jgi:hypothetical protein
MTESPETTEQPEGPSDPPGENPDENTSPPSSPEPDPERVEQDEEDADRTIAS